MKGRRWQRRDGVLALKKVAALGEDFTLGGAAVLRWEEHVPWLAERYGLVFVDSRLPESNFFKFDVSKIKVLLGYEPWHDVGSVVETAEAIFWGEESGVVRTWVRSGRWG